MAKGKKPPEEVAPLIEGAPTEPPPPPTSKETRIALRYFVENFYDFQERRLATKGRTFSKDIQLHEMDKVRLERAAKELETSERNALNDVKDTLKRIPVYQNVLSDKKRFRGLGPTMAGVILSSNDIERQDTRSKMWAFAGLRPLPAVRCAKCHQVVEVLEDGTVKHPVFKSKPKAKQPLIKIPEGESTLTLLPVEEEEKPSKCTATLTYASGKAQRPIPGQKLTYNKWLRTKLVGVLGPCLLKANSPWRSFYDNYKHRKESAGWGISDGHRHNAAIRYMVKMLLGEIWQEWRLSEGLSVRVPYEEEYLGRTHHESAPSARAEGIASDLTGDLEDAQIAEELRMAEED